MRTTILLTFTHELWCYRRSVTTSSVRAVAALDDPQRARLYEVVRTADGPVTREEAAATVGISRKLAAFHLDRLVDAGLLVASYERVAGDEPRLGRSPKRYRVSDLDVSVSIPARHYDFVGEILLDAVTDARPGEDASDAVARVARARGRSVGGEVRAARRLGRLGPERALTIVAETLADLGFEPVVHAGVLVQRNCPFHRLAEHSPELVCGINREFVDGMLEGLDAPRLEARLDPADGRCCVVIAASG